MKHGLSVFLWLMIVTAFAGDEKRNDLTPVAPKFRVALTVTGNPKAVPQTRSYLAKALRAIPDIEISEAQPSFRVICIVSEISGEPSHVAMSVTIATSIRLQVAEIVLAEKLSGQDRSKLREVMGPLGNFEDALLQVEESSKWEESCKELVAGLDGRIFEKARTMLQEVKEGRFKFINPQSGPIDLRKEP